MTERTFDRLPDWLAWLALAGMCFILIGIGNVIYATVFVRSIELALIGAGAVLIGSIMWERVITKAEKLL